MGLASHSREEDEEGWGNWKRKEARKGCEEGGGAAHNPGASLLKATNLQIIPLLRFCDWLDGVVL